MKKNSGAGAEKNLSGSSALLIRSIEEPYIFIIVSQTNFLYICKGMNSFYLIYAKVIAMFLFFFRNFPVYQETV